MWHAMFVEQIPSSEKILRTVLVYALVAVLIRLSGKRGLAGLNTLDIVVMTLLSNVVQNAIIGNDLSITGGAIGAVTLVAVNAVANRLAVRNALFERLFDGTDTKVITNGELDVRALNRLGVRSTARLFVHRTKPFLYACYALAGVLWAVAGAWTGLGPWFFAGLLLPLAVLAWQAATIDIDDPAGCLRRFRSNREAGLLVALAILLGRW